MVGKPLDLSVRMLEMLVLLLQFVGHVRFHVSVVVRLQVVIFVTRMRVKLKAKLMDKANGFFQLRIIHDIR